MKRGREEDETCCDPQDPNRGGGAARRNKDESPSKRKKWTVVRYVQKLLTSYFLAPRSRPGPKPVEEEDIELSDASHLDDGEVDGDATRGVPAVRHCR